MSYNNLIVLDDQSSLRRELANSLNWYRDADDPNVYWVKSYSYNPEEYQPIALASDKVKTIIQDGDSGEGSQGPQGAQGAQGPQGATGAEGSQGAQGSNGADGVQGPQGPSGIDGTNGSDGLQGAQGPQGAQGIDGSQGPQGPQGSNGADGAQGAQGANGADGTQGADGPQGPQGETGDPFKIKKYYSSIEEMNNDFSSTTVKKGNWVMITTDDETAVDNGKVYVKGDAAYEFVVDMSVASTIQGPQGSQGEVGPQGPQGEVGPKGTDGAQGIQGEQGIAGPQGEVGPQGPQGIQGEQGIAGPQGEVGPQGATGAQGANGSDGAQGPQGATGTEGPQGPQGEVGPQGPQGAQGSNADTIEVESELQSLRKVVGSIGGIITYTPSDSSTLLNAVDTQNSIINITSDINIESASYSVSSGDVINLTASIQSNFQYTDPSTGKRNSNAVLVNKSDGGTVTINGTDDTIIQNEALANMAISSFNNSNNITIINGGKYIATADSTLDDCPELMYCYLGTIKINGGIFRVNAGNVTSKTPSEISKYILKCYDANYINGTAKFSVTGGKFYDFNPSESYAEGTTPVNWVAEGYTVQTSTVTEDNIEHTIYEVVKS